LSSFVRVNTRLEQYSETAVPWLVLFPLLFAIIIGISMRSAAPEIDAAAYRPMAYWRGLQVAGLATVSMIGVIVLTTGLDGPVGSFAAVRNFIGFLGLALLSGFLFGGRMAWLLPVVTTLPATTIGNPTGDGPPWDWPVRIDDNFPAFVVSIILVLSGLATLAAGTRERRDDADA
jgi:hypothetical protein